MEHPWSTYYRWRRPSSSKTTRQSTPPANQLSKPEQDLILSLLFSDMFVDQSPYGLYYWLLNEGIWLASIRTMYRLLASNQAIKERRRVAKHPPAIKPVLKAYIPNEVWTWDITRLPGPCRGQFFYLYLMLDLYSRYVVGWMLAEEESSELAQTFLRESMRGAQATTKTGS